MVPFNKASPFERADQIVKFCSRSDSLNQVNLIEYAYQLKFKV